MKVLESSRNLPAVNFCHPRVCGDQHNLIIDWIPAFAGMTIPQSMTKKQKENFTETLKVHGTKLLATVNKLAREGNVRRIIVKDKYGKILLQFPMLLGLAGALISPLLASISLIAFFVTEASLVVERMPSKKKAK